MSREITSAAQGASQAEVARPALLAELDFPSGFVRVNSTDRSIFFDSQGASPLNEFLGVGRLGSVSTVGETSSLQARGVELALSGIPSAHISAAFESAQGRPGRIWIGFLDDSYALIVEPVLVFSGLIDNSSIDIGETATVTVTVESRLIAWERAKIRRYTNEDQQQRFSGESPTITDKFLEFVNQTVDKEILWGVGGDGVPRRVSTSAAPAGEMVTERGETFFRPSEDPGGGGGGGGDGGGGGACFAAGTLVEMADGSEKPIESIVIGEETRGGRVTATMIFAGSSYTFDYAGIVVEGCHAVQEDGTWKRVEDSERARRIDRRVERWYNLNTSKHEIWVDGLRFGDDIEVDHERPAKTEYWAENIRARNQLEASFTPVGRAARYPVHWRHGSGRFHEG